MTFSYILYLARFTLLSARPDPITFHIIPLALIIALALLCHLHIQPQIRPYSHAYPRQATLYKVSKPICGAVQLGFPTSGDSLHGAGHRHPSSGEEVFADVVRAE